jgi:predicted amidophosphoribosyltransferase
VSGALAVAPRVTETATAGSRGPTLEERLSELLDRARAHEDALCPVCQGGMGPSDQGAYCRDCGTTLV